jgi:hypothetical protein
MRLRHLLPIALLALGALVAPACSSDDSSDTASGSSNDRDTSSDTSDSDDSGSPDDPGSNPDEVPGLDDLTESIPGLGDMGDCISQAAAFSSLYFETLGGEDGAKDAQRKAEELKEVLPDDLHDDIEVISKAIGTVADEGLLSGTDALDTEEYRKAEEAISKYFQEECGSGG